MGRYYNSGIGKGIGTSPQTTLQNQEYENKVKEIEEKNKKNEEAKEKQQTLCSEEDLKKLENAGVKFNKEDVIFVANDSSGQLIWLEKGNEKSGLSHIKNRHAIDFREKHSVSIDKIPQHIKTIIEKGKLEYSKVTQRNGRECYERLYSKSGKYFLQTGVGSNGYLVSAYPISEKEALALIRRNKK